MKLTFQYLEVQSLPLLQYFKLPHPVNNISVLHHPIIEPIEQAASGWSRRAPTLLLLEVFEVVNWIQLFQASGKPALSCLRHFNPTANCTRLLVMDRAQDQRQRALDQRQRAQDQRQRAQDQRQRAQDQRQRALDQRHRACLNGAGRSATV